MGMRARDSATLTGARARQRAPAIDDGRDALRCVWAVRRYSATEMKGTWGGNMKERYEYHFHTKRLDTEVHLLGESAVCYKPPWLPLGKQGRREWVGEGLAW